MKKLLLVLALALSAKVALAQQPQPLLNTWMPGISSTTIIDNRPAQTRQMAYVSIACSGSGTWQAALAYASSSGGAWTSYGASGIVSNSSATAIGYGFKLVYPNYIRVAITGTATCNLSGFQRFFPSISTSSGTVTEITIAGTANQITATGTCAAATTTVTCTLSVPSAFVLPGTINGLTLTTSTGTITVANGKTVTVNNTLTLNGTDATTITFPASSATVATLGLTNTFTGRQDSTGAASTAPAKTGTSLPGTCVVGDLYFKSDATAGQNLFECAATDTWTQQLNSGTLTSITLAGTANQITVSGTCTVTTTGTCTFSLPSGLIIPGTINGLTLTTSTGTITLANAKILTVNNSLTLAGTDGVTVTFPASSATVATLGLTNVFTGRQDATGAASTAPAKTGTSLPGTCIVGDVYFKSDASAGQNIYGCTATNTWTAQGGAGSGTVTSVTISGTANQVTATGASCTAGTTVITCTLSIPSAFVLPGTINGLTLTTSTGTITLTDAKTFTVLKSLTLEGTDGVTITFPASSATVATLGLTNAFTGRQDASGAASTAPSKVGTSPPGTCIVGDQFFDSDATAGSNLYGCTATNTWTAESGGGTGSAAASGTTTCSGATPAFTATSNTIQSLGCTLVATNVTGATLAGWTTGQIGVLTITQPAGGAITFAAITGLTGDVAITGSLGTAASEYCIKTIQATAATTGTLLSMYCSASGTVVNKTTTNTFGAAGTLDLSAATNDEAFRLPNVAGAANTTEGACSFDTTGDNVHCGENGVDTIIPSVLASALLVNGNCVQASVASSRIRLSDAGAPCGTGGSGATEHTFMTASGAGTPALLVTAGNNVSTGCPGVLTYPPSGTNPVCWAYWHSDNNASAAVGIVDVVPAAYSTSITLEVWAGAGGGGTTTYKAVYACSQTNTAFSAPTYSSSQAFTGVSMGTATNLYKDSIVLTGETCAAGDFISVVLGRSDSNGNVGIAVIKLKYE